MWHLNFNYFSLVCHIKAPFFKAQVCSTFSPLPLFLLVHICRKNYNDCWVRHTSSILAWYSVALFCIWHFHLVKSGLYWLQHPKSHGGQRSHFKARLFMSKSSWWYIFVPWGTRHGQFSKNQTGYCYPSIYILLRHCPVFDSWPMGQPN